MNTPHTPGPWEFIYGSVYQQDGRGFSEAGLRIAMMDRDEPRTTPCERDSNARLIAAAPELLAACRLVWDKVLTEYHSKDSPVRLAVEAAIAKAEGKSKEEAV